MVIICTLEVICKSTLTLMVTVMVLCSLQLCLRCARDSRTAGAGRVTLRWATCCWAESRTCTPPPHVVWWGLRWSALHTDRWDSSRPEKHKALSVRSISRVFKEAKIWFCLVLNGVLLLLSARDPHPEEHVEMKAEGVAQTFLRKHTEILVSRQIWKH